MLKIFILLIMTSLEIKEFRKKHNITQEELANITGTSLRAVKSWEYGERNISKGAVKLIQAYFEENQKITSNISMKENQKEIELLKENNDLLKQVLNLSKQNSELLDRVRILEEELRQLGKDQYGNMAI